MNDRADVLLARLAGGMRSRWPIGLAVFVLVAGLVAAFTLHQQRTYTATVEILTQPPGNGMLVPADAPAETYVTLLSEAPLADRVAAELHLGIGGDELRHHLFVRPFRQTPVIELAVTLPDRAAAVDTANALAEAFVDRERDLLAQRSRDAATIIERDLPAVRARRDETAAAFARFQRANGTLDVPADADRLAAQLAALDADLRQARLARDTAAAENAALAAQIAVLPATVRGQRHIGPDAERAALEMQLSDAIGKRDAALAVDRPEHPAVVALQRQIAALRAQIAARPAQRVQDDVLAPNALVLDLSARNAAAQTASASAAARVRELQRQRTALAARFTAFPQRTAAYARLERDARMAQDVLAALEAKRDEAIVAKSSAASDVTIVKHASEAGARAHPDLRRNVLVGAAVGLVLAFAVLLAIEFFDDRIRDRDDLLHNGIPLPVLATLGGVRPGTVLADPFAEILAALRLEAGVAAIAVSPLAAAGGALRIAVELGHAAADAGHRVLIVDTDLRAAPPCRGLADLLAGEAAFDDVVTHDGSLVDVVFAGTARRSPLALLQSARFRAFIAEAKRRYTLIVVSTADLQGAFEASVVGACCDVTVLVVSPRSASAHAMQAALERLTLVGARRVAGVVFDVERPRELLAHAQNGALALPNGATT